MIMLVHALAGTGIGRDHLSKHSLHVIPVNILETYRCDDKWLLGKFKTRVVDPD
jgi:hypothetical protein